MNRLLTFIQGASLGATVSYLFDADSGPRHRALLRDRLFSLSNDAVGGLEDVAVDTGNRLTGLMAVGRSRMRSGPVSDEKLVARVRSQLGHMVSHPSAIEVTANQGTVTLSGPILAGEVQPLLMRFRLIPGVKEVVDHLDAHTSADGIPALMGGPDVSRSTMALNATSTPPVMRLGGTIIGSLLLMNGLRRGGLLRLPISLLGASMLLRTLGGVNLTRLVGMGDQRRAVDVHKSITINATAPEVFDFFSHFENLPRFMSHLEEVKDLGGGRSHWVAAGPAATPFEWDAVVTKWIPNQLIGWKSVPGSVVRNAGMVRFTSNSVGSTTVDVSLSYNPPAGALGHAVASLFGVDPKSAMDDDLARLKTLVEQGQTTTGQGQTMTADVIDQSQLGGGTPKRKGSTTDRRAA